MIKLDDSRRMRALQSTGLLDTPPEPDFDRATRLVCKLLSVDVSLVSLVDDARQFFKSSCGLPTDLDGCAGTPLSHSFCQHVVTSENAFVVNNALEHELVRENLAIRDLNVMAYLGVPIRSPNGLVMGSLCAIHGSPRNWTAEEQSILEELASLVEDAVALRAHALDSLSLATNSELLAREYNHRAKNLLSVVRSLVSLSSREATTAAELSGLILGRLDAYSVAHDAMAVGQTSVYIDTLLRQLLRPYDQTDRSISLQGPPLLLSERQITPVCLLVHELATNSAKHGAIKNAELPAVSWTVTGDIADVAWRERAPIAADAPPAAPGFGSRLMPMAARQLGGDFNRRWEGDTMVANFQIDTTPMHRA